MIKNDYAAKNVEEFNDIIDKLKYLNYKPEDSLELIDASFKKFFGFSSNFANSVSIEDLKEMLKTHGRIDGTKYIIAASLIKEEGIIYNKLSKHEEDFPRYLNSFNLFLKIYLNDEDTYIKDYIDSSDYVAERLIEYPINSNTKLSLFKYYEKRGHFAKCEDIIYELMDDEADNKKYKDMTIDFYTRLLEKTDEELEAGNLPREEVIDGLNSIK